MYVGACAQANDGACVQTTGGQPAAESGPELNTPSKAGDHPPSLVTCPAWWDQPVFLAPLLTCSISTDPPVSAQRKQKVCGSARVVAPKEVPVCYQEGT